MTAPSQTTLGTDQNGKAAQLINPYTTAYLTTGGICAAFEDSRYVRIYVDADCYVRISKTADVASATNGFPMTGGTSEYFHIKATQRISVLGANLSYTIGAQKREIL